jgi:hypothetical protein
MGVMQSYTQPYPCSVGISAGRPPRMALAVSHGAARATQLLKTLDPSALLTAMSPDDRRATSMLANKLGREVPAA